MKTKKFGTVLIRFGTVLRANRTKLRANRTVLRTNRTVLRANRTVLKVLLSTQEDKWIIKASGIQKKVFSKRI
jgi:hypothetical protein